MSMPDDEPYDADGDVSRFLHCPSPEAHLFPLSEPEGTLVGPCQNAPPATIDEVQGHQAPQTLNAAPDLLGHQVPATTQFQGHPAPQAVGVAPDFGVQAPTTTEFQEHPPALDFGVPVPAIDAATEHYQTPIVNAEQHQASAMDVDYYQPMAVDNIRIRPTQMLAAPEMHHHAYGGFQDPTSSLFQANNNMHMLANGAVSLDPSPSSVYQQLVNDGEPELAAILWDIERGDNDVHPVKEDVIFRPFIHGQLDCSRCRSVREVMCLDEARKMHFMVHALNPGMIFQHAIVHRMSIAEDGHFRTEVLLHHDLRGRNHEWVHNFIERSVEMMKTNRGQIQDTNNCATVSTNVAMAPPTTSIHAHMEQLEAIDPAATTATQPAVTPQEQQGNITGPGVAETAPEEAAEPAVTPQEQGENTDAPGVTDALGAEETAVPEAAQPVVTAPQEEVNTDAPADGTNAAGPQAVEPPAVTQKEEKKDAGAVFNWEGFQAGILESSLVLPYDPESGTNVLLYPSLVKQLHQNELRRKESKRLSKMPALDPATYLEMSDEDSANEPKLGSLAPFRRLCEIDPTYRIYSRRINCINRKVTKLRQTAPRVGTRGLFAIKQKMETYKREKAELYDMVNKALEENGAGPSNRAEPSNRAGPSNEAGGTSNEDAIPSSSDGAGTSNDAAIPSADGADTSSSDDAESP